MRIKFVVDLKKTYMLYDSKSLCYSFEKDTKVLILKWEKRKGKIKGLNTSSLWNILNIYIEWYVFIRIFVCKAMCRCYT